MCIYFVGYQDYWYYAGVGHTEGKIYIITVYFCHRSGQSGAEGLLRPHELLPVSSL